MYIPFIFCPYTFDKIHEIGVTNIIRLFYSMLTVLMGGNLGILIFPKTKQTPPPKNVTFMIFKAHKIVKNTCTKNKLAPPEIPTDFHLRLYFKHFDL